MRQAIVLLVALGLVAGCRLPGAPPGCTAQIDWVDFIQVGSTQYVATGSPGTLVDADLGPVVAHVKSKLAGNICDPNYRPKDGDAAFLDPGTSIYQVNRQPPSQLLAARHDGRLVGYVAHSAP